MNSLTYVMYSHTDFLDILEIAVDYVSIIDNKVLLINHNDKNIDHLYSKFKKVLYYDDNLSYSEKLNQVLTQIDSNYILFSHEVDIVLSCDQNLLNQLVECMDQENIDRIDLQPNGGNTKLYYIKIIKNSPVSLWPKYENIVDPHSQLNEIDYYIGVHDDPKTYIFNVNPSIWKISSFLELLRSFPNRTYRDIEYEDVQNYCKKFKIYNLYSKHVLHCGYLKCLPFYKYLHITHYHRLLRFNSSFTDEFGQSYIDASQDYINIINNYNLQSGKRIFS